MAAARVRWWPRAADTDAFHLLNQQYWEINNLEVTNKKSALGDDRGISINGQNGGTLNHIYVRNCFVHDVTGQVNWIGGDTADNAPGITFQTGWDRRRRPAASCSTCRPAPARP